MSHDTSEDIMDDLFHGSTCAAFVEQSSSAGGIPCLGATRRRASLLYEKAFAERNGQPE